MLYCASPIHGIQKVLSTGTIFFTGGGVASKDNNVYISNIKLKCCTVRPKTIFYTFSTVHQELFFLHGKGLIP